VHLQLDLVAVVGFVFGLFRGTPSENSNRFTCLIDTFHDLRLSLNCTAV